MEYAIIEQGSVDRKSFSTPRIFFTNSSLDLTRRICLGHVSKFKRHGFKPVANNWLYKHALGTYTLAKGNEAIRFVILTKENADELVADPIRYQMK